MWAVISDLAGTMGKHCCQLDNEKGVTLIDVQTPDPEDGRIAKAPAVSAPRAALAPKKEMGEDSPDPEGYNANEAIHHESEEASIISKDVPPYPYDTEPSVLGEIAAQPERLPGMVLSFQTLRGAFKVVSVTRRPLGLQFKRTTPLEMCYIEPGSECDKQGVQTGWKLMCLNGDDISTQNFETVYLQLHEAAQDLLTPADKT
mmetsp:Transcript_54193/g.115688  ORF Transcript_54193/g.115688 Transcript_54193/m.115688 type:complete len:202 (+) Transcript_54193:90-695(+)